MIREILESVKKGKIKESELNELKSITKNETNGMEVEINGEPYSSLETVFTEPNTMFYTINSNGKIVSKRMKSSQKVKKFSYNGNEYLVTNLLNFQGKKWIREVMFSRG